MPYTVCPNCGAALGECACLVRCAWCARPYSMGEACGNPSHPQEPPAQFRADPVEVQPIETPPPALRGRPRTPKHAEIPALLAEGLSDRAIAARVEVSRTTVAAVRKASV